MKFRPCIDIHNGKVKQIVGGSLNDINSSAHENFVSEYNASHYASMYKKYGLSGGHIIMLNSKDSEYAALNKEQAFLALHEYPSNLQVGGGINDENALDYLENGASHVIVTSFVFKNGDVDYKNLDKIYHRVGKKHLVLDLSCRFKDNFYYIVTDRWQKYTQIKLSKETLNEFSAYCDEFLIHAVDVEGCSAGIDEKIVNILCQHDTNKIVYAGGVGSYDDLFKLKTQGKNKIDVTVGSALDIFGGKLEFKKILDICK